MRFSALLHKTLPVLIYPYWNVNVQSLFAQNGTSPVLIYPYWNVNENVPTEDEYKSCFNLSILECKSLENGTTGVESAVLIYPYWNVNLNQ